MCRVMFVEKENSLITAELLLFFSDFNYPFVQSLSNISSNCRST